MIKQIEIERFSLTTSKPFDATHEARSFAELKRAVERGLSKVEGG